MIAARPSNPRTLAVYRAITIWLDQGDVDCLSAADCALIRDACDRTILGRPDHERVREAAVSRVNQLAADGRLGIDTRIYLPLLLGRLQPLQAPDAPV